jgi:hypothetical protein
MEKPLMKVSLDKVLSSPYFPNRDALAGGTAGILAFALAKYTGLDHDTTLMLVTGLMGLVFHFMPLSMRDLAKEADTVIKDKSGAITDLIIKFDGRGTDVKSIKGSNKP